MTLQTIEPFVLWPYTPWTTQDKRFRSEVWARFQATTHKLAVKFQVPATWDGKKFDKAGFRTGGFTTGSSTVRARLETIDAGGNPSGTLASANCEQTGISPAAANTWYGNSAWAGTHTASAGEKLAVVIDVDGGSAPSFYISSNDRYVNSVGWPLIVSDVGAGYAQNVIGSQVQVSLGFDDDTWASFMCTNNWEAESQPSITSTGVSEAGSKFTMPFGARAIGLLACIDFNGDIRFNIGSSSYLPGDSGATRLATGTVDADQVFSSSTSNGYMLFFDDPVTLAASTVYYATVQALDATGFGLVRATAFTATNSRDAILMGAKNWQYAEEVANVWSESDTALGCRVSLILDQLDDAAGGGSPSGVRNPLVGPVGV